MHIHILGICGTFMGGIALIARQAGHTVTGCDANVYPPMSTQLAAQGIELIEGYAPDQIALKPDLYVIGNVITRGNPLLEEILDRGLPVVSGPQWLAEHVLRGKWVLAVAGTHGKTTASAMLAWVLEDAGLAPGFLIGGVPENFGVSARLTASPFFVIEADEYDTAFFDKRSKFVHYRARTVVLNNLEFDHADIFPDLAAIETQFHHFVRTVPAHGLIIANGRDASLERVLKRGCWTPVERFAVDDGWQAQAESGGRFRVSFRGEPQGEVAWDLLGEHNRLNALAAIAAARHAGVPASAATDALARFRNVKRRMEIRGVANGVTVYDDFAHHPTAIEATLSALRSKVNGGRPPAAVRHAHASAAGAFLVSGAASTSRGAEPATSSGGRIVAVVEPRSNTMKLGVMKEALAASLALADRVFCYSAGLKWDVTAAMRPLGEKVTVCDDFERLLAEVAAAARPGDHVLVMSNGGFGGIHEKLLARLAGRAGEYRAP
ncbi:MAG: UDP-N-acetylmuramate:L-alanyl-gamma-D-glutamyl-meso-diaminopimelate ligase [Betaproteobacteria bacterium]|nr:UDP-N-acetylmuramate:L-alanyl-gamma-D-glutamyl-meso-diaminopimelate ligase [Betaproteobacteria bacterium]